jgi:hypothetical protein
MARRVHGERWVGLLYGQRALYEVMVGALSNAEREALRQDYVRFGELFLLPRVRQPVPLGARFNLETQRRRGGTPTPALTSGAA